jgi:pimeloyl-ACP methyl ester carboxylesterase
MTGAEAASMLRLQDGPDPFEVLILEAAKPARRVLFSVGAGGDPQRHLPLLRSLCDHGCTVVAPRFERMATPTPSAEELRLRARRLALALASARGADLPLFGAGHSIGAAMLLVLAGAEAWTRAGEPVSLPSPIAFERLVLLAPATDFFRAPGALDRVRAPLVVWAGTDDRITPPAQAEFLQAALASRTPVELRIAQGAGHFSFMDEPPPQTIEPLADRTEFLAGLAAEIARVVAP